MFLMLRFMVSATILVVVAASGACAQSGDVPSDSAVKELQNPYPYAENTVRAGLKIYGRQCLTCHGKDGKGKTDKTAEMPIKPVDFTKGKFKFGATDGEIFRVIKHGTKGGMLPYAATLKDSQIWHLVNYVRSFGPKKDGMPIVVLEEEPVPENPLESSYEALSRGKRFYAMHCVKCHGADGMGDTEMREFLETHPSDLTNGEWKFGDRDGDIFNVVKNGAGKDMPPFSTQLNDERIWQVVLYLRSMGSDE
jgi:mono/diheme cytochrome c family protein